MIDRLARLQALGVTNRLGERAETELSKILAQLRGHEAHVRDDVLGFACEAVAQLGILGCDARRTRIEMADAHHETSERNQRRRSEAEFLGAEKRGHHNVAAGLELTVGLDGHAAA